MFHTDNTHAYVASILDISLLTYITECIINIADCDCLFSFFRAELSAMILFFSSPSHFL